MPKEKKVMRFQYNNKTAVVLENGNVVFQDKKVNISDEKLKENYIKFLTSSHKELLDVIEKETSSKTEKFFYCMLSDGHMLLAVSEMGSEIKAKSLYKAESKEFLDIVERLIGVKDGEGRVVIGNFQNNFNFLAPNTILRVMFSAASIRSKGEELFHKFKLKSKNGKIRDIIAPHEEIKEALQKLNSVFQYIFDKTNEDFQVAYKKGKSIVDNADIHKSNKFIFNVDLKDFYPSCKRDLVQKYVHFFFKNSPNGDVIENEFLNIILHDDGLFIGSPISGTLANAIISKPVRYIKNIAKGFGMEFSVYADDMTFSSNRFISQKLVENVFNLAFTKYNLDGYFKLNAKKSHGMSNDKRRITGISINNSDEATVSRNYYRDLRVKIHKLSIGDTSNINIQKMRGKIAFALMVDESKKIQRLLGKFLPTVKAHRLVSSEKIKELNLE
jgi:hypothetical protein